MARRVNDDGLLAPASRRDQGLGPLLSGPARCSTRPLSATMTGRCPAKLTSSTSSDDPRDTAPRCGLAARKSTIARTVHDAPSALHWVLKARAPRSAAPASAARSRASRRAGRPGWWDGRRTGRGCRRSAVRRRPSPRPVPRPLQGNPWRASEPPRPGQRARVALEPGPEPASDPSRGCRRGASGAHAGDAARGARPRRASSPAMGERG